MGLILQSLAMTKCCTPCKPTDLKCGVKEGKIWPSTSVPLDSDTQGTFHFVIWNCGITLLKSISQHYGLDLAMRQVPSISMVFNGPYRCSTPQRPGIATGALLSLPVYRNV